MSISGSERPQRGGFKKIFGKIRRSNSGGQIEEQNGGSLRRPITPEFRRGGPLRSTAGPRLNGNKKVQLQDMNVDQICGWLEDLGLGLYCNEVEKSIGTGERLAKMTAAELETKLNVKHPLHRKKLFLALSAKRKNFEDPEGCLDYQWVLRWLDDVGLPQYKETFLEAKIDGRVLNVLTVDDLFQLKVTNLLHHLTIKSGIKVLRMKKFDPDCLRRRAIPGESHDPMEDIALWSNHRVMEWLKEVDLSEYAPNLRGSGVHGGLMIHESRFNDDLLASLLSIPTNKTLLRRHLSIHFKELVGKEVISEKRSVQASANYAVLSPTAKAKNTRQAGQFTLKRRKSSKSLLDFEDLVCPFTVKEQEKRSP